MEKAQYAILRFAKYKGPEIGRIEAHDERTKEKYASNPDVDTSQSRLNFHLVKPHRSYRAEAEKQIAELNSEIDALKKEVNSSKASVQRQLELTQKVQELDDLRHTVEELQQVLDTIPPEILASHIQAAKTRSDGREDRL